MSDCEQPASRIVQIQMGACSLNDLQDQPQNMFCGRSWQRQYPGAQIELRDSWRHKRGRSRVDTRSFRHFASSTEIEMPLSVSTRRLFSDADASNIGCIACLSPPANKSNASSVRLRSSCRGREQGVCLTLYNFRTAALHAACITLVCHIAQRAIM